ncbi:MAG: AraC family transcriptional regulator [Bacteroidota bacterium]
MTLAEGTLVAIEILAVGNGFLVGLYLMARSKISKPTFLLGIFLVLYALIICPAIFKALRIWDQMHLLKALPIYQSVWFMSPTFYYYTQNVSAFKKNKHPYWMLVPGLFLVLIKMASLLLGDSFFGIEDLHLRIDKISFLLGHFYIYLIASLNLRYVNAHIAKVGDFFSSVAGKELKWAKAYIYFCMGVCTFSLIMVTSVDQHDYALRLPYAFILFFSVVWLSFHGTRQLNVARIMANLSDYGLAKRTETAKRQPEKEDKEMAQIIARLRELLRERELYADSELNIVDVAVSLGVHPKKLSRAINSSTGGNFNRYINEYRVERAKELLKDPDWGHFTIDGVGKEVGFQSKSTFYRAFKVLAGTTPLEYQNS